MDFWQTTMYLKKTEVYGDLGTVITAEMSQLRVRRPLVSVKLM